MNKAKSNWINQKCTDIGKCLIRNNTKKVYSKKTIAKSITLIKLLMT